MHSHGMATPRNASNGVRLMMRFSRRFQHLKTTFCLLSMLGSAGTTGCSTTGHFATHPEPAGFQPPSQLSALDDDLQLERDRSWQTNEQDLTVQRNRMRSLPLSKFLSHQHSNDTTADYSVLTTDKDSSNAGTTNTASSSATAVYAQSHTTTDNALHTHCAPCL